jgi:hypothetical protein
MSELQPINQEAIAAAPFECAVPGIEMPPAEEPSFVRRLIQSTFMRRLVAPLAFGAAFSSIAEATPALADDNPSLEYTVDANTAAGGVYARSGPHTDETQRTNGYGAYPGDTLSAICGVTDGDPVGPYNNTTWHYVVDENNPGEGKFWINAHYIDSPDKPGQLAPGEQNCDESSGDNSQPAESVPFSLALTEKQQQNGLSLTPEIRRQMQARARGLPARPFGQVDFLKPQNGTTTFGV